MESLPVVPYWHIWTDTDGISHQSRCELAEFQKASIQPAAAPQWIGAETRSHATVLVTVLPVGWIGDWHENPRPQWIIPLSGRWFVESMDGVRVEMAQARFRLARIRTPAESTVNGGTCPARSDRSRRS
jgi:hypothetical protein